MSKIIYTRKGEEILVDDEDYETLTDLKWCLDANGYPITYTYVSGINGKKGQNKIYLMHRMIMNTPKGLTTDHINHIKTDNRKINLRICSQSNNARNSIKQSKINKYKGVAKCKGQDYFVARINNNNKGIFLGNYRSEEDAALAYDRMAEKLFGEFALLNLPDRKDTPQKIIILSTNTSGFRGVNYVINGHPE